MKKLWYNDECWDVVKIISPNKYDKFILCKKETKDQIHSDGKTTPVCFIVLDVNNDTFCSDTKEVQEIISEKKRLKQHQETLTKQLTDLWLETIDNLEKKDK